MVIPENDGVEIIAELANTHEGSIERAKRVVDAVPPEADAIKLQSFTAEELMVPDHPNYDSLQRKEFSQEKWTKLIDYIHDAGYNVYSDVFGVQSADLMDKAGVEGFKIHSSDISNHNLISDVATRGKPVFLAAGGTTIEELRKAVDILRDEDCEPEALIYGFQEYPTDLEDTHLRRITSLYCNFDLPIGFAPHIDGASDIASTLPQWGVAAGAEVVEIHITVDRSKEPTDYESSLTSEDFRFAIEAIGAIERALGADSPVLSDAEMRYRNSHKKFVTTERSILPDEQLTPEDLSLKRIPNPPSTAISDLQSVAGRATIRELAKHEVVTEDHLEEKVVAVLACRARSERLYGKPMQQLDGRPIIEHLIDRLELVDGIDEVTLAIADTPDKHVFIDYAKANGHPYVVGSEEDVLERLIEGAQETDAGTVVRATTENPFVHWQIIDDLIDQHNSEENDLTTVHSMPSGTHVEIIERVALEVSHDEGEDRHRSELCTLYINENDEQFDVEELEPPAELERPDIRLTVDYPSDLMMVRRICNGLENEEHPISLPRIIEFLDKNPKVRDFNASKPNETRLYD